MVAWGGQWLNNVGKLILIKAILSSLPIYQASFLLAPKEIIEQISKVIRDFLWKGGKGNQRKFHLVNWDIIKHPKNKGGLQIRDPGLVNTALGDKILWQLFSNQNHPISRLLRKKYLSLRNLQVDNTPQRHSDLEFMQKRA